MSLQPKPADDAAKRKKTDEPIPDDENDAAAATGDTMPTGSFVASAEDEEDEEIKNKPEKAHVEAETVGPVICSCLSFINIMVCSLGFNALGTPSKII